MGMARARRALAVSTIVGAVAGMSTACGTTKIAHPLAFSMAYEASVDKSGTKVRSVEWTTAQKKGELKTHTLAAPPAPWRLEGVVASGETARLTVVPAPGAVAKCRILDGTRVLAEAKSPAPGKPAVCEKPLTVTVTDK